MDTPRIAVNIADLTRIPPIIAQILLGDVTARQEIVKGVEPGMVDDGAVVLGCDGTRARAIIDVMRRKDHAEGRYATRAYVQGPRGGWHKL